jgi:tetratricopeptide (TPR) repeat protein
MLNSPDLRVPTQIRLVPLTPTEEIQILCSVARDQIAIGNYQAAALILKRWAIPGKWPRLFTVNAYAAADLLFTAGNLFGWIAGSRQVVHGHKHAEAFLNGAVAIFEQLGAKSRSLEAQIELGRCYYRQGLLEIAKETISSAIAELPEDQLELRTFGLVMWGVIERDSGRLKDSLLKLREAANVETAGQLVTNRCYLDLATTLKELALFEQIEKYLDEAKNHFWRALYESEALGHHRNVGAVENNIGFLLLGLGLYKESEEHLLRSRRIFEALADSVRGAQVNDTLARLYLETKQLELAQEVINRSVESLELTDSEALLAEALTTKGVVASRTGKYREAKRSFEAAHKVAQRCGDNQGAARAVLAMLEEMAEELDRKDACQLAEQIKQLLLSEPQSSLKSRVEALIARISEEEKT